MTDSGISVVLEQTADTISCLRMSTMRSVHPISRTGRNKCMQSFAAKVEAPDFETHCVQLWMMASTLGLGGSARLARVATCWRIVQMGAAIWHAVVVATSALFAEDPMGAWKTATGTSFVVPNTNWIPAETI